MEFATVLNALLIMLSTAIGWVDRRRMQREQYNQAPIVLECTFVIDPTGKTSPSVATFQRKAEVDKALSPH